MNNKIQFLKVLLSFEGSLVQEVYKNAKKHSIQFLHQSTLNLVTEEESLEKIRCEGFTIIIAKKDTILGRLIISRNVLYFYLEPPYLYKQHLYESKPTIDNASYIRMLCNLCEGANIFRFGTTELDW